jgi:hypothetical protein
MEIMTALHATVDAIATFNTPIYVAAIPAVQRPMKQAAFSITS